MPSANDHVEAPYYSSNAAALNQFSLNNSSFLVSPILPHSSFVSSFCDNIYIEDNREINCNMNCDCLNKKLNLKKSVFQNYVNMNEEVHKNKVSINSNDNNLNIDSHNLKYNIKMLNNYLKFEEIQATQDAGRKIGASNNNNFYLTNNININNIDIDNNNDTSNSKIVNNIHYDNRCFNDNNCFLFDAYKQNFNNYVNLSNIILNANYNNYFDINLNNSNIGTNLNNQNVIEMNAKSCNQINSPTMNNGNHLTLNAKNCYNNINLNVEARDLINIFTNLNNRQDQIPSLIVSSIKQNKQYNVDEDSTNKNNNHLKFKQGNEASHIPVNNMLCSCRNCDVSKNDKNHVYTKDLIENLKDNNFNNNNNVAPSSLFHDNDDDNNDFMSKPSYYALCTKCGNTDKKKCSDREGLIIQSNNFQRASNALSGACRGIGFKNRCNNELNAENVYTNQDSANSNNNIALNAIDDNSVSTAQNIMPTIKPQQTFFDRSKFIQETVLIDGHRTIKDYYDLNDGNLGKGSYGIVVKARDLRNENVRAVKIVYKPRIENIERIKREILIMKRLDHPNIIKLYEVYEDYKSLFLVMELCTGGELFDRIIKSGYFSERYAAFLIKQVFSAIAYCHLNGIMHRDLKPENLLYADQSAASPLKVIDWGFASKCCKGHKYSSVIGTPYYVAPDVLFGNYDKGCDIWSAGIILYILLCGYPPFNGKENKEILHKVKTGEYHFDPRHWKRVSDHAKDLIQKCLEYDPKKRIIAQEALQHPWIQYYATIPSVQLDNHISLKFGSDLVEKFKKFQRFNKMKRLAVTCVAYQLTETEIGALHDVFAMLDTNMDGVLTCSEVEQGLQQIGVSFGDDIYEILSELDTDGNGSIDYTEFIAASIDQKLYEQESACRTAFRIFDLDGDGKITMEELREVLQCNFVQEAFSFEVVEQMVKEVDCDNDGSIDFDEFMKMMRGKQRRISDSTIPYARTKAILQQRLE